ATARLGTRGVRRRGETMKAAIVVITAVLIAAWGCGKISSSVEAQNPPQFSGTFAFGNGPLVGATTATNGSLTGNMVFAGSCLAQITGTYQETAPTALGQLTATPLTAIPPTTRTSQRQSVSPLAGPGRHNSLYPYA